MITVAWNLQRTKALMWMTSCSVMIVLLTTASHATTAEKSSGQQNAWPTITAFCARAVLMHIITAVNPVTASYRIWKQLRLNSDDSWHLECGWVADGYRSIVSYLWGTAQTNSSDRYTGKELSNQYFQLHLLWVSALKGYQMDNGQNWNPFENGYGWNNLFSHRCKMRHHRAENCSQCTLRKRGAFHYSGYFSAVSKGNGLWLHSKIAEAKGVSNC